MTMLDVASEPRDGGGAEVASAHIVMDARMVGDGGVGTYIRNLLPRIAAARPEWRITALGYPEQLVPLIRGLPNVHVQPLRSSIYGVGEQIALWAACPRDADLFWAPHYNVPLLVTGPRLVVTVHDVCHLALPETAPGSLRQRYARYMFRAVQRRALAVLFVSEFSRGEMERLVGPLPEGVRSRVTPNAAAADWWTAAENVAAAPLKEPYFVYVGNVKRHKNLPLLLRAFARVRDRLPHRLVLVGRREGLRADPEAEREAQPLGDRVLFTGEISFEQIRRYVVHSTALVTVSRYEGFGIPPLEAMAAGVPCVVSNAAALPEVCGDAALYCNPTDEADIAERLIQVANDADLRRQLIGRGRVRAASFSWDRSAEGTVEVLESALGGGVAPRTRS